jgi:hypothetical protein
MAMIMQALGAVRLGLLVWAVVGPLLAGGVTWASMRAHEAIVVSATKKAVRLEEVARCQKQLVDQISLLDANTMAGVADAGNAADSIDATPEDKVAIVALCKRSASCRDREAGP